MRVLILSCLLLSTMFLFSCEKEKSEQSCSLDDCAFCEDHRLERVKPDGWDNIVDKADLVNNIPDKLEGKHIQKYILSPLVREGDCGYIISGKIKYVITPPQDLTMVTCGTGAPMGGADMGQQRPPMEPATIIVDYGDGTLDAWAVKTIYREKNGKKKGKGMQKCGPYNQEETPKGRMECCKFEQECNELEAQVEETATLLDRTAINTDINTK